MRITRRVVLAAAGLTVAGRRPAAAQNGPRTASTPRVLQQFDPSAPACIAPPGLARTLIFAQDNKREFMQRAATGLAQAARHRGLSFEAAVANNDPNTMVRDVERALADRAGALVVAPIHVASIAPILRRFIAQGGYVGSIVPPPATTILNAPQFATGKVLGEAAAAYIRNKLAGEARVVLLTHDTNQFLAQRFVAIRSVLKNIRGVRIIADISPRTVDKAGGYDTMRMILVAHSRVDVVLGADTVVLGALTAVREAGLVRNDQFFGGIDGEPEAIAEMRKGGPYKASVGLASPIFGYALGSYAADWLDGRSVPQGIDILPSLLSLDTLFRFERDAADPDAVFADPTRRDRYLSNYGNTCYDTRDAFIDFGWSSETKP